VPIAEGRMTLGTWQGLYLVEHRRAPHQREIVLHSRRRLACTSRSTFALAARALGHADRADRARLVDAQHEALAEIKVIVDAVLAGVAGAQVLPEDEDAEEPV
jgi:hypothetical protein